MKKCELLFDNNIKPLLGVISNNKDQNFYHMKEMIIFGNSLDHGRKKTGK